MKQMILSALIILSMTGAVFAQEVGGPNPEQIGIDAAQQNLKTISIDKFEYEGLWRGSMSSDAGYVTARLFKGGPDKEKNPPIEDEEKMENPPPNEYVLGARVDFLKRGHTNFTLAPLRPLPVEGITKTVSVWVVGRNYNHSLSLLVDDYFGRQYELYMGSLNFQGWKQMTVAIPPQGDDGKSGIVQKNYHYNNQLGLKIAGFKITCDPSEAFGTYYIYFDDLRAVTDLFADEEANKDTDDMRDYW